MQTPRYAIVAILPIANLEAALTAYGHAIASGAIKPGAVTGATLVYPATIPPAGRQAVAGLWPAGRIVDGADADALATVLAAAGAPDGDRPGYTALVEEGNAILILWGADAGAWPRIEQALAPHLRAAQGGGDAAAGETGGAPPFAVFGPDADAAPQTLSPPEVEVLPDRPAAPVLLRRFADVRAPALVPPATAFPITVALTRQAPAAAQAAPPLQVRAGRVPVSVLVYAVAFEVLGPARHDLAIDPDGDSGPVVFHLRAYGHVAGEQQVSVTFLQGVTILGRVVVTIEVGGHATSVDTMPGAKASWPASAS